MSVISGFNFSFSISSCFIFFVSLILFLSFCRRPFRLLSMFSPGRPFLTIFSLLSFHLRILFTIFFWPLVVAVHLWCFLVTVFSSSPIRRSISVPSFSVLPFHYRIFLAFYFQLSIHRCLNIAIFYSVYKLGSFGHRFLSQSARNDLLFAFNLYLSVFTCCLSGWLLLYFHHYLLAGFTLSLFTWSFVHSMLGYCLLFFDQNSSSSFHMF